jgi:hypothetical protein
MQLRAVCLFIWLCTADFSIFCVQMCWMGYHMLQGIYRDMQCIYVHEVLSVSQAYVNPADI